MKKLNIFNLTFESSHIQNKLCNFIILKTFRSENKYLDCVVGCWIEHQLFEKCKCTNDVPVPSTEPERTPEKWNSKTLREIHPKPILS